MANRPYQSHPHIDPLSTSYASNWWFPGEIIGHKENFKLLVIIIIEMNSLLVLLFIIHSCFLHAWNDCMWRGMQVKPSLRHLDLAASQKLVKFELIQELFSLWLMFFLFFIFFRLTVLSHVMSCYNRDIANLSPRSHQKLCKMCSRWVFLSPLISLTFLFSSLSTILVSANTYRIWSYLFFPTLCIVSPLHFGSSWWSS